MINLILFLVQNIVSDVVRNDIFRNILSCPVSLIGDQSMIAFENSYLDSRIIHQLHSTPYPPYI
jgi:hypothetical protein